MQYLRSFLLLLLDILLNIPTNTNAECQALQVSENCNKADFDFSPYSQNSTTKNAPRPKKPISDYYEIFDKFGTLHAENSFSNYEETLQSIIYSKNFESWQEEDSSWRASWGFSLSTYLSNNFSSCLVLPSIQQTFQNLKITITDTSSETSREFDQMPLGCVGQEAANNTVDLTSLLKEHNTFQASKVELNIVTQLFYDAIPIVSSDPVILHEEAMKKKDISDEECTSSSYCCAKHVEINMTDIHMNAVIHPRTFTTNICIGYCGLTSPLQNFVYEGGSMRSCCVPTEYKPMEVLYMKENERIVKETLPRMKITKCGCS